MKKLNIGITVSLSALLFSCSKAKNDPEAFTATGRVTAITYGAHPSKPGVVPYSILLKGGLDSIMVTNLPADIRVKDSLAISYVENDTMPVILLAYRVYPRSATIVTAKKQ